LIKISTTTTTPEKSKNYFTNITVDFL